MKIKNLLLIALLFSGLLSIAQKPGNVTFHIVERNQAQKPFFRVTGTERFWTLEMSGSGFKFKSLNEGESFDVPYKAPVVASDGKSKTYKSQSDKHDMVIDLYQEKCSDGMTDTIYAQVVKLSIKKTDDEEFMVLKGCGNYVPDSRLAVVWVLDQIKGKKMTKYDFGSELPYIDLHVKENLFTGFGGCNRLKGNLVLSEHNLLQFKDFVVTKMSCLSNNKEGLFLEALGNCDKYEIKNDKLILSNKQGVQAVFLKGT